MKPSDESAGAAPRAGALFSPFRSGSSTYRSLDLETQVASADPHRLIEMLYDGCMVAIAKARMALASQDVAGKGESTTKAIRILEEGLKASLDPKGGGEISGNLSALYDYMTQTLMQANLRSDDTKYAEVEKLLEQLRSAWKAIGGQARGAAGAPASAAPRLAGAAGRR